MKQFLRRINKWIGPKLFRMFQRALRNKSPEQVERMGEKLAAIWWRVSKKRRERAIANLEMAFPEWTPEKREEVARGVFDHFGRVSADFMAGTNRPLAEQEAAMEVRGWEHFEAAQALNRGIIVVTGHFGNWERMSALLSTRGYKVTVVARDADQAEVNDMVNDLRRGPGTQVVARGDAARTILQKLKANEIIGILPDQNAKEIFIPFFGHPAGTVLGPGVIAERAKSPVLPVSCVRVGVGKYVMTFEAPLEPVPGCEQKGEGTMRAINIWLEGVIRKNPEQWLWIHDRWRMARKRGLLKP